MKIYNLGSLNIDYVYQVDHFVQAGETLSSANLSVFPGGKGLNQSVALAKAGADAKHIGLIGQDGGMLLSVLAEAGAATDGIKQIAGSSGHAIIQVDPTGQNCILLFAGANHGWDEAFIREALADAQPGDMLLLQNEINAMEIIFAVAKEKGLSIALNPSPFNDKILALPLEQVGLWLVNEVEGAQITGLTKPDAIADELLRRFPGSRVVLTLGKHGVLYADETQRVSHPIFPVKAVDTTAAGDTFTGYFLAAITRNEPVAEALRQASAASAIGVSRAGASCSIPSRDEVMVFLK